MIKNFLFCILKYNMSDCNTDTSGGHMICTTPFTGAYSSFQYMFTGPNPDSLSWKTINKASNIGSIRLIENRQSFGKSRLKAVITYGPDVIGGINKKTEYTDIPNSIKSLPDNSILEKDPRLLINCLTFNWQGSLKQITRCTGIYYWSVPELGIGDKLQGIDEGFSPFVMNEFQRKDIMEETSPDQIEYIGNGYSRGSNLSLKGSFSDSILCGIYTLTNDTGNQPLIAVCCAFRRFFDIKSEVEYVTLANGVVNSSKLPPKNFTSSYIADAGTFINQLTFAYTNYVGEKQGAKLFGVDFLQVEMTGINIGLKGIWYVRTINYNVEEGIYNWIANTDKLRCCQLLPDERYDNDSVEAKVCSLNLKLIVDPVFPNFIPNDTCKIVLSKHCNKRDQVSSSLCNVACSFSGVNCDKGIDDYCSSFEDLNSEVDVDPSMLIVGQTYFLSTGPNNNIRLLDPNATATNGPTKLIAKNKTGSDENEYTFDIFPSAVYKGSWYPVESDCKGSYVTDQLTLSSDGRILQFKGTAKGSTGPSEQCNTSFKDLGEYKFQVPKGTQAGDLFSNSSDLYLYMANNMGTTGPKGSEKSFFYVGSSYMMPNLDNQLKDKVCGCAATSKRFSNPTGPRDNRILSSYLSSSEVSIFDKVQDEYKKDFGKQLRSECVIPTCVTTGYKYESQKKTECNGTELCLGKGYSAPFYQLQNSRVDCKKYLQKGFECIDPLEPAITIIPDPMNKGCKILKKQDFDIKFKPTFCELSKTAEIGPCKKNANGRYTQTVKYPIKYQSIPPTPWGTVSDWCPPWKYGVTPQEDPENAERDIYSKERSCVPEEVSFFDEVNNRIKTIFSSEFISKNAFYIIGFCAILVVCIIYIKKAKLIFHHE